MTATALADQSVSELWRQLRQRTVQRLWVGIAIAMAIGLPLMVYRATEFGLTPLYSFYLVIAVVFIAVALLRKRICFAVQAVLLPTVLWIAGATGTAHLGLLSTGPWWMAVAALLTMTLYNVRAGIVASALTLLWIGLIAAMQQAGWVAIGDGIPADDYVQRFTSWFTLWMSVAIMLLLIFTAVGSLQQSIVQLMVSLERQHHAVVELASRDPLTGLPTARVAADRLELALARATRRAEKVAVLFIDVDNLKPINDRRGHDAGDSALTAIASRLQRSIRDEDTAARIGADEFLIVLGGLPDSAVADRVAAEIVRAVKADIFLDSQLIRVTISVGVAIFPDDATVAESLRRRADEAMYAAKRAGGNGWRRYRDGHVDALDARRLPAGDDGEDGVRHTSAITRN